MTDATTIDLDTATPDQLSAIAASLGLPLEALKAPDFPDFRDGLGYKLKVTHAQNKKSRLGADQVELTVNALDEDDQVVKRARGKIWLTYPFDTETFKFKDYESRERSIRDMMTLVRCSAPDARYDDYAKVVTEGAKKHYFDVDGNELVGVAFKAHKDKVRILALHEIKSRRDEEVGNWVNTVFYAQYKITEKDGAVYKNWQNITKQPKEGVVYIHDAATMLVRPGADVGEPADAENLF
jgi:hypothetical protein